MSGPTSGGTILGREPVLALNVITAIIALATILWPQRLDPSTQAAIVVVAIAVISFIARSQVTPVP